MKALKNITTLLLSLLICYTSSGADLALHFCGGKLNKVAFSAHDANCGMDKNVCKSASLGHKTAVAKTDTCCKDQILKSKVSASDLQEVDYSTYSANILKSNSQQIIQAVNSHLFVCENIFDNSPHPEFIAISAKSPVYLLLQNFRI